ncbi:MULTISPECIES: response regulator [Flammeovirga]|uniref:Response regulator n=1 Tax=Flammeovirga agarivorans TaxID=2726742 RepID=A0A7X8XXE8_9BACT|nr:MULTISPECIES: response regulator [Flammeovirga]NLR93169.1 response regulator [Flammeovirga agarivorans]
MALANGLDKPVIQRAIVVDNNIINAHYLKKMLADEGMEITIVSDTIQLYQFIQEEEVKMVFLDSETLGSHLEDTIFQLKQRISYPVTIVGTTPYSLAGARKKLIGMGVEFALSTPIYKKHLREIIKSATIA